MPKIRLIEVYGKEFCDDNFYDRLYVPQEVTDWEEVSDTDLVLIEKWIAQKNLDHRSMYKYAIVREPQIKIAQTIKEILKKAKDADRVKKEAEKRKKEAITKRQKTVAKKREEREKQLLAKLQDKYGESKGS